jgi:hypothetical protein
MERTGYCYGLLEFTCRSAVPRRESRPGGRSYSEIFAMVGSTWRDLAVIFFLNSSVRLRAPLWLNERSSQLSDPNLHDSDLEIIAGTSGATAL